jgi:hypothetical protein
MAHQAQNANGFRIIAILAAAVALGLWAGESRAATIYVNSLTGDNRLNGFAPQPINESVGPVRTLQRALQIAGSSDTISLVNNGTPYYGCFTLVGERASGSPTKPFRIIGNGSVLSGSKPILPASWYMAGVDLWRVTPLRKGHAVLLRGEQAVPEVPCPEEADELPPLPEGHWCLFQGAVYYQSSSNELPPELPFSLADDEVGLTLLDVHDVEIHDLVVRHFRLDGINVHDRCSDVLIQNVVCEQNGRAGITVAGSSRAVLLDVVASGNREHSVLVRELGEAIIEGGDIDPPATLPEAGEFSAIP